MSILGRILNRHQHRAEKWAAVLDENLRIGGGYLEQAFNTATTALIVVDVQKGYCDPCLSLCRLTEERRAYHHQTAETLGRISEFSAAFEKAGGTQLWLRHTKKFAVKDLSDEIENYNPSVHDAKLTAFLEMANELCLPVDPDRVVDKRLHNGFEGTDLEDRLRQNNIKSVLIAGGMRRACVQKTAEGAANRHFMTFIVDDLTIAHPSLFSAEERGRYADEISSYNIYPVTRDQVHKVMGHTP